MRIIHGDPNPLGPGFIEEEIETDVSGLYPGRVQQIATGSYIVVPDQPLLQFRGSFTFQAWIMPTLPEEPRQAIVAKWDEDAPSGFALLLEDGALTLLLAGASGDMTRVSTGVPLVAGQWCLVAAVVRCRIGNGPPGAGAVA